jgi:hypothetical protein
MHSSDTLGISRAPSSGNDTGSSAFAHEVLELAAANNVLVDGRHLA